MFGDFLGFVKTLQKLGINGEFWSCFPVTEFFDQGTYTDIKFGRKSGFDWKPMEVLTKFEFQHRAPFWRQFPAHEPVQGNAATSLKQNVECHIGQVATKLQSGDIFNIILIGHGEDLLIEMAGEPFHVRDFTNLLNHFRNGVRINLVVMACQSGSFIDTIKVRNQPDRLIHTSSTATHSSFSDQRSPSGRFRNSRFTGTFLASLGLMAPPTRSEALPKWNLDDHIDYVKRHGRTSTGVPCAFSSLNSQVTAMKEILFSEFIEIAFIKNLGSSRRVLTPFPLASVPTATASLPPDEVKNVEAIIRNEVSLMDENAVSSHDAAPMGAWFGSQRFLDQRNNRLNSADTKLYHTKIRQQLEGIKWRFRIQEPFYLAVGALANHALLRVDLLMADPIDMANTSSDEAFCASTSKEFQPLAPMFRNRRGLRRAFSGTSGVAGKADCPLMCGFPEDDVLSPFHANAWQRGQNLCAACCRYLGSK